MSEDLDRVLAVLAKMTEDALDAEDLASEMSISIPRSRHYLRELHSQNLVWADENGVYGLSAEGDAYIVANELDIDS